MAIKISIAQMNILPGNPSRNIDKGISFIEKSAADHADLVLLPELWTSGFDLPKAADYARLNREILADLQKKSNQLNICIAGSYLTNHGLSIRNSLVFLSPKLPPIIYHKMHLFPSMDESRYLSAGKKRVKAQFNEQKLGFAICYDMRFPDLFWNYSHDGVTSYLLPAQWPHSRISHWDILSRSRAVENQACFIGCNAVGIIGKTNFGGSSCIIQPDGTYLVHASKNEEELLIGEINIEVITEIRNRFPVLQ